MSQWAGVWIGLWEGDWKGENGLELEELHGGVTKPPARATYKGGRRDLDALERAQAAREEAARRKAQKAAERAQRKAQAEAVKPKPEPVTLADLIPEAVIAQMREAASEAKRLERERKAQERADAIAQAIALEEQQDEEAAEAFMAFLLAA